jgi:hypothetical protein
VLLQTRQTQTQRAHAHRGRATTSAISAEARQRQRKQHPRRRSGARHAPHEQDAPVSYGARSGVLQAQRQSLGGGIKRSTPHVVRYVRERGATASRGRATKRRSARQRARGVRRAQRRASEARARWLMLHAPCGSTAAADGAHAQREARGSTCVVTRSAQQLRTRGLRWAGPSRRRNAVASRVAGRSRPSRGRPRLTPSSPSRRRLCSALRSRLRCEASLRNTSPVVSRVRWQTPPAPRFAARWAPRAAATTAARTAAAQPPPPPQPRQAMWRRGATRFLGRALWATAAASCCTAATWMATCSSLHWRRAARLAQRKSGSCGASTSIRLRLLSSRAARRRRRATTRTCACASPAARGEAPEAALRRRRRAEQRSPPLKAPLVPTRPLHPRATTPLRRRTARAAVATTRLRSASGACARAKQHCRLSQRAIRPLAHARRPRRPPARRSNREAVRKYRARKKEEEGRAAAELAAARAQVASLAADNARLRALLGQIGGLAAAGGLMAPPPPLQRF